MTDDDLSLCRLWDADVLADPYPLYRALREQDPVHWDPYLHAWVVTGYADAITVLHKYSADCTPTPDQLNRMGCDAVNPIAQMMVKQMLFMDAPGHTRLRGLAAYAFAPSRVESMRAHVQEIADKILDELIPRGRMEAVADFAERLPAIVTAEMMGLPVSDVEQLKEWSDCFAELLGNYQRIFDNGSRIRTAVEQMTLYFQQAIRDTQRIPREGLLNALITAEVDGSRLSEEEVVANSVLLLVGGQETTANWIGSGLLTLLRHPDQTEKLRTNPALIPGATEELLRFESPSQRTARVAPADVELGGKKIRKGQAVIVSIGAANRDPQRFADPDRLDLERKDNKHLAFGYASHFCLGASVARLEGQIAFATLLRRLARIEVPAEAKLTWSENVGLRGLNALPVRFEAAEIPRNQLLLANV